MKRYTVKQVARMSGVSVRTLHYYDQIGLLRPAEHGDNGYRYYGREELLRLQQILFYRELKFPLDEVRRIMSAPDFDKVAALRAHRARLEAEAETYQRLLVTIDRTIHDLTGETSMKDEELYYGLNSEKQKGYERWLVDRFGGDMQARIDESRAKLEAAGGDPKIQAAMKDAEGVHAALTAAMEEGLPADSDETQAAVHRHYQWICNFWTPNREAYAGLADLYLEHPDFRAFYDKAGGPGLVDYLAEGMTIYAERRLT